MSGDESVPNDRDHEFRFQCNSQTSTFSRHEIDKLETAICGAERTRHLGYALYTRRTLSDFDIPLSRLREHGAVVRKPMNIAFLKRPNMRSSARIIPGSTRASDRHCRCWSSTEPIEVVDLD